MARRIVRQCEFQSGAARTVGWVEDDKRLKIGVAVRLKDEIGEDDPNRWWVITRMSQPTSQPLMHRGFHAGGL